MTKLIQIDTICARSQRLFHRYEKISILELPQLIPTQCVCLTDRKL